MHAAKESGFHQNGNDIVNVMLDGVQFTIMHQNTYRTIWTCLNQQLFYKHSEWIIKYWNAANSLLLLHLADFQLNERIYVSYTSSGQVIADSKMVKLRQKNGKSSRSSISHWEGFCCSKGAQASEPTSVLHQ